MSKPTRVIILGEDPQHTRFARQFLIACGFEGKRIRVNHPLLGQGSGEQHVREHYPQYVHDYRRYRREDRNLVIVIDADIKSVEERLKQLDDELEQAKLSKRQQDEKIGIFTPKRNIETWIYYLQGHSVNETEDYKGHIKSPSEGKLSAIVLARKRQRHEQLPDDAPPSLQAACSELDRLFE
jgi:hypothetical protein